MTLQKLESPRTLPARVAPKELDHSGERELSSIVADMWGTVRSWRARKWRWRWPS